MGLVVFGSNDLLALIFRLLFRMSNASFLVAPFILFMLYGLVTIAHNSDDMWYIIALTLAKVLPVLICAIFLAKQDVSSNET